MTSAYVSNRTRTCKAAASTTAASVHGDGARLGARRESCPLSRVSGFLLLTPLLDLTPLSFASDTGEFRGRSHRATGRISFDDQSPARVEVSLPVTSPQPCAKQVRFVAREFRPSPGALGARREGVMVGRLEVDDVERPVRIPIVLTIDGPILEGRGRLTLDLADVDEKTAAGAEVRNDIAMEVYFVGTWLPA